MIGSDTLLFPDTGPDFLRSLRTEVLYSKRVHVLTMLDPRMAENMTDAFGQVTKTDPIMARRLAGYFTFVRQTQKDLLLLKDAGILVPLDIQSWDRTLQSRAKAYDSMRLGFGREMAENGEESHFEPQLVELLDRGFDACPPSYFDLDLLGASIRAVEGDHEAQSLLKEQETACRFSFMPYLLMLAVIAEERGVGLMSWSPEVQNAFWALREQFTERDSGAFSKIQTRRNAEAALGHVIIEKHLPMAEDLPFQEILKIRESRTDELDAFSVALAELATRVDLTQWQKDSELQIHDLIASRVDPALRDLRASLKASRLDVLTKIGKSWGTLASATVPAAVACVVGAPLAVSAAVAALGPVVVSTIETVVHSKKLLNASQWSILLRMKDRG